MNIFQKANELKGKTKAELSKELNGLIGSANSQGSNLLARMMLERLTFNYESSYKFKNSEEQVDSYLEKYPNMIMYRQEIIEKARKYRTANGLNE
jgi:hypothetical protein